MNDEPAGLDMTRGDFFVGLLVALGLSAFMWALIILLAMLAA